MMVIEIALGGDVTNAKQASARNASQRSHVFIAIDRVVIAVQITRMQILFLIARVMIRIFVLNA